MEQPTPRQPWSAARAIVTGAIIVGTLDALDAIVFFGLRGAAPSRIFQGIASGLLGRASFQGGLSTAALGVGIHFFIAASIATAYYAASRRYPTLLRHPVRYGLAYGVAAYAFMNAVVIPLSAITRGPMTAPVMINGLLIHMLGVGLPSALVARAAGSATTPAA